jgi:hypothetical protein
MADDVEGLPDGAQGRGFAGQRLGADAGGAGGLRGADIHRGSRRPARRRFAADLEPSPARLLDVIDQLLRGVSGDGKWLGGYDDHGRRPAALHEREALRAGPGGQDCSYKL